MVVPGSPKPVLVQVLKVGIVEIRCRGHLDGADTGYLPDLAALMAMQPGRVCLLFETLEVVHFTAAFALNHVNFLRSHQRNIKRIAVVYALRTVPMSILAVSASTGLDIRGFSTLVEALPWLESSAHAKQGGGRDP